MIRLVRILTPLALVALCIVSAPADRLVFTSGAERQGLVKDDPTNPEQVIFTDYRGTLRIQRSKLEKIVDEPDHVGHLAIGDGHFQLGHYDRALKAYEEARNAGAPEEVVRGKIEQTRDMQEKKEDEKRLEHAQEIDNLIEEAGQFETKGDFRRAKERYDDAMALGPSSDQRQRIARRMTDLHLAWGKQRVDRMDKTGAAEHFQIVRRLDPDNEEALRLLIDTWKDDPDHAGEVADYYATRVARNPTDLTLRLETANAYYRLGEYAKALPHYVKLFEEGAFSALGVKGRLRDCYEKLHQAALDARDYKEALKVYKEFYARYPDIDPKVMDDYEYIIRREEALAKAPKDERSEERLNALAQLGFWCRQVGLHEKAKKEFQYVLAIQPDNRLAEQGMSLYARDALAKAQAFYDARDFAGAMRTARGLVEDYPNQRDIVELAIELMDKTKIELARLQQAQRAEARKYAGLGDEYYATAQQHIAVFRSSVEQVDRSRTMISDYQEAMTYLDRAIDAWKTAIGIDPSMASSPEYDLQRKVDDAKRLQANLARDRRLPPVGINPSKKK